MTELVQRMSRQFGISEDEARSVIGEIILLDQLQVSGSNPTGSSEEEQSAWEKISGLGRTIYQYMNVLDPYWAWGMSTLPAWGLSKLWGPAIEAGTAGRLASAAYPIVNRIGSLSPTGLLERIVRPQTLEESIEFYLRRGGGGAGSGLGNAAQAAAQGLERVAPNVASGLSRLAGRAAPALSRIAPALGAGATAAGALATAAIPFQLAYAYLQPQVENFTSQFAWRGDPDAYYHPYAHDPGVAYVVPETSAPTPQNTSYGFG